MVCKASWYGWRTERRTAQRTRCSKIIEITRSRLSRNMDQDSSTSMTKKVGTILWFRLEGICTVTQWQAFFGRENPRRCSSKTNGRTCQHWECLYVAYNARLVLVGLHWTTSKWLGRADPRTHVENAAKEIDVEHPTPLIDPVYLGCTQREKQRWIIEQFEPKLDCSEH